MRVRVREGRERERGEEEDRDVLELHKRVKKFVSNLVYVCECARDKTETCASCLLRSYFLNVCVFGLHASTPRKHANTHTQHDANRLDDGIAWGADVEAMAELSVSCMCLLCGCQSRG